MSFGGYLLPHSFALGFDFSRVAFFRTFGAGRGRSCPGRRYGKKPWYEREGDAAFTFVSCQRPCRLGGQLFRAFGLRGAGGASYRPTACGTKPPLAHSHQRLGGRNFGFDLRFVQPHFVCPLRIARGYFALLRGRSVLRIFDFGGEETV